MSSIRSIGTWTDDRGFVRNAVVDIVIEGTTASVNVAATVDDAGEAVPTKDRRIAWFLGRVEQKIRAVEYASRSIVPDPKPTAAKRKPGRHP